jgi:hypothetical protein
MGKVKGILRLLNLIYCAMVTRQIFREELSWFSLHPLLMSILWFVLCEGIVAAKAKAIKAHQSFMLITTTLGVLAGSLIYQLKSMGIEEHFESSHSLVGTAALSGIVMQFLFASLFGGMMKYKLFNMVHKANGFATFLLVATASWLQFGSRSGWFLAFGPENLDLTVLLVRFIHPVCTLLLMAV